MMCAADKVLLLVIVPCTPQNLDVYEAAIAAPLPPSPTDDKAANENVEPPAPVNAAPAVRGLRLRMRQAVVPSRNSAEANANGPIAPPACASKESCGYHGAPGGRDCEEEAGERAFF